MITVISAFSAEGEMGEATLACMVPPGQKAPVCKLFDGDSWPWVQYEVQGTTGERDRVPAG